MFLSFLAVFSFISKWVFLPVCNIIFDKYSLVCITRNDTFYPHPPRFLTKHLQENSLNTYSYLRLTDPSSKPFIPHETDTYLHPLFLHFKADTYYRSIMCLINIQMKSNEPTIKTPVSGFTDNQIREAIDQYFNNESPLDMMIGIFEIMSDYIMNNDFIEQGIRDRFSILEGIYRFHFKLFMEVGK